MSRSRSALVAATAGLSLLAAGAGAAVAQDGATAPASPQVLDLRFPILDLDLPVSSLDGSVRRTEGRRETRITLAADILFAFDRSTLGRRASSRLDDVAAQLRDTDPASVRIEGHTDDKGSDAYNLRLSERRAQAVRRALRGALGDARVTVVGRGESEPVAANRADGKDSPKGRARNRRVEIRLPRAD